MQFLPANSSDYAAAVAPFMGDAQNASSQAQNDSSFNEIYSSFIEEGRNDYTGLPQGFSANTTETGTLDREDADQLQNRLRKRGAQDASLETLEQLMAAGGPMTVGRIFAALSGSSRVSPTLEGQERLDFKQLMGKLGFTGDESEELLQLSDKGAGSAIWRKISGKMQDLGQMELHGEELSALMKGLDISEGVKKQIQKLLGEKQSLTLSREQLDALLAEAGKELAGKDLAAASVRKQMRAAMEEALAEAKLNKKSEPSADAKGTRLSEVSEISMQQSIQKKITDQMGGSNKDDAHQDGRHREDPSSTKEGMGRAERILSKGAPGSENAAPAKNKTEEALNRMMQRIDAAGQVQAPLQPGNTPQMPAAELASRHRQEIFTQVEQGILTNFANGGGRLTLQLNPQELGQINVVLTVHQGEVRASIRAENAESAAVLSEQMQQLKSSLEEAGLKVAELDVQTGIREDFTAQNWNGAEQHNLMHDAEERARMRRIAGLRREAGQTTETGHTEIAARTGTNGLHIVA